jgi:polysaccharide biosynthesis/export protein
MRNKRIKRMMGRVRSDTAPKRDLILAHLQAASKRAAIVLVASIWLLSASASSGDNTAPASGSGSLAADSGSAPAGMSTVRPISQLAVPGEVSETKRVSGTNTDGMLTVNTMASLDDRRKLGVGDRIIFRVLEDQEDPKALTVTDSGEIDVPELGLVAAAGKTCKQLAFEVQSNLLQATYYRATVIIGIDLLNKTMSGRRVYVAGQVHRSGPQQIPAGETWTVSKAILAAGGFTDYADKKRVRVVRSGATDNPDRNVIVNVAEVWEKGRAELDLSVESEDLIYVPTRAVNF